MNNTISEKAVFIMRIISGKLKGRKILGYDIEGTRPTMDRVKESVFGSIQNYIDDSVVLDLFAGSGNLGIEAISNGSLKCYFVDNNKKCISIIKDNIKQFGIEDYSIVIQNDYKKALEYFKDNSIKFDIIFIDPPYKYEIINELIDIITRCNILNDNGIMVLEYSLDKIDDDIDGYQLLKYKKYGDKYVSIYKKN